VISLLLESNNIDDVEKVIQFYNSGGEMIAGDEDLKQSHKQIVSFMTIHDICIPIMQEQDIDANQGDIAYTIKVHGLKNEAEEDQIDDQNIVIREGLTIKELKSFILSITK
jgi:hypothetical protein